MTGVHIGAGLRVAVGAAIGVVVWRDVLVLVSGAVRLGLGIAVLVNVSVLVGVFVGVLVAVAVGVFVMVGVIVAVGVCVGLGVTVLVAVGVIVFVGVGIMARPRYWHVSEGRMEFVSRANNRNTLTELGLTRAVFVVPVIRL